MLLFVYGTLKRGFCNHHRLAGAKFVGAARTHAIYRLLNLGWYPGLIEGNPGIAVEGELWDVDEATLRRLDEYEGVPEWFQRRAVALDGTSEPAEAYFYCRDPAGNPDCGDHWETRLPAGEP
jgi:gamma-glutamylcyclotransferase (GGCT)/AIG2-like uncharacterized protein YtfP